MLGPRDIRVKDADTCPALSELPSWWERQTLNKHAEEQNVSGCSGTEKNTNGGQGAESN